MPTAPLLSPNIDPSSGGTQSVNVSAPVEAFGGAVGQALQGVGHALEGASDKLWQRAVELQNLNNDTEAKKADTDYMIQAGELHAKFSSLEGENARAAYPQYIKDLQSSRESIRGNLSNPMAQKMYDASSMNFMGRSIFNGAGHAATQTKQAAVNASKARVETLTDNIGANPEDENGFQRSVSAIRAETRSQGSQGGWSEDQIRATSDSNVSGAVAKRIVGLARTDPFAAQTMFDTATKDKALNPIDAGRVQATIQTQSRQVISRGISSEVNADLDHPTPEGEVQTSLEDRIAEAEGRAQRYAKNDPLLTDFVKQRVIADYNRFKAVQRDFDQRNEQTVAGAMMTGNKEGILPKSVDELKIINPEVGAAWDSLKPTTQRKYMQLMAHNAKGEMVSWTDASLRQYQSIKGQAIDDPVEFLARDVISETLPNSAKRELVNLQQRLRSQSQDDPRVQRAMQMLQPDLVAAGITKKDNQEGYFQFVGAMQDALDAQQKDTKKVPSLEEVRKIGARLMQEQTQPGKWFGLIDGKTPLYQTPIPDDEVERLKADPYWAKNGLTPNDSMLRRIYISQKYNELYRGSSKKPAEASFPPQAGAPVSQ